MTRNEALDCRVYARAATFAFGLDRWGATTWDRLRDQLIDPERPPVEKPKKPGGLDRYQRKDRLDRFRK